METAHNIRRIGLARIGGKHLSEAPNEPRYCGFPDCKCPMDPGPEPWCAIGLPQRPAPQQEKSE